MAKATGDPQAVGAEDRKARAAAERAAIENARMVARLEMKVIKDGRLG